MMKPTHPSRGPGTPPNAPLRAPVWKVPAPLPPALTPPPGLVEQAAGMGIEFEPGDVERLGLYLALLLDANQLFNLTAIKDPAEAWTRHILDSLTLIALLVELPAGSRVIDVGSGGGLPGIPLAICLPALSFTLLEATGKKAEFLRAVAGAMGLTNVSVLGERAECAAQDRGDKQSFGAETRRVGAQRESYDAAVARAVGPLATIAELTVPFVKPGGRVLLIKGQKADEELKEAAGALRLLNAVHAGTIDTPSGRIVVLDKSSATPRTYPRRDGEPKRSPLK